MDRHHLKRLLQVADVAMASGDYEFEIILQEFYEEALQVRALDLFVNPELFRDFVYRRRRIGQLLNTGAWLKPEPGVLEIVGKLKKAIEALLNVPLPLNESRFPTIKDEMLRGILERDLDEAASSFTIGNWKSCQVICGSILEAALYEYLLRNPAWTMKQPAVPVDRKGKLKDIEDKAGTWTLADLIDFCCANKLIDLKPETLKDTLKDPRNLIHPMAERREAGKVDRETAQLCLAMTEAVLKALSQLKDPT